MFSFRWVQKLLTILMILISPFSYGSFTSKDELITGPSDDSPLSSKDLYLFFCRAGYGDRCPVVNFSQKKDGTYTYTDFVGGYSYNVKYKFFPGSGAAIVQFTKIYNNKALGSNYMLYQPINYTEPTFLDIHCTAIRKDVIDPLIKSKKITPVDNLTCAVHEFEAMYSLYHDISTMRTYDSDSVGNRINLKPASRSDAVVRYPFFFPDTPEGKAAIKMEAKLKAEATASAAREATRKKEPSNSSVQSEPSQPYINNIAESERERQKMERDYNQLKRDWNAVSRPNTPLLPP